MNPNIRNIESKQINSMIGRIKKFHTRELERIEDKVIEYYEN